MQRHNLETVPAAHRLRRSAVVALVAGAVFGGGFIAFQAIAEDAGEKRLAETRGSIALPDTDALAEVTSPPSFADLAEAVRPGVVGIRVEGNRSAAPVGLRPGGGNGQMDEFFRRYFGPGWRGDGQPGPRFEGQGSGFIIDPEGLVVTNHHVIDGAEKITVILDDGGELEATLRGTDPKTELALLEVATDKPLAHLRFGDSDASRVGDWVVAVGNPFGLGGSFTAGIISARGRDIRSGPFDDFLQVDAPINRGNSGGPLFNHRGEVVGINTAIFSPNGGNVGIGFAIPSAMAQPIIDDLRDDGRVDRAFLGVTIQSLDPEIADAFGLEESRGALVATVVEDGPAARAGIEPGDVVLSIGGTPVEDSRDLARQVALATSGEKLKVVVWRDGEKERLTAVLDLRDEAPTTQLATDQTKRGLGVQLQPAEDGRGVVIF